MSQSPTIVSIVGLSDSGKTTFLEKLIPELKKLGLKVAAIKHDIHDFDIDHVGKDSWRLGQTGADAYAISGPRKFAVVKNVDSEMNVRDLTASYFADADIVLTEGYKRETFPKIEVYRKELNRSPLCEPGELFAFVSDVKLHEAVPTFSLDDASGVAAYLVKKFS